SDETPSVDRDRGISETTGDRLGDAKVDDLWQWRPTHVAGSHEQVARLEITVDDTLGVRVLHGAANLDEQLQPLFDRKAASVAILGDRDAFDKLHDEIWPALGGGAGVKNGGDSRML